METYRGVVESYDASTGEHTILYEDNERAPTLLREQEDAGLLTWRDPTARPAPTRAEEAEGEDVAVVAEAEGLRLHLSIGSNTGYKGVRKDSRSGRFKAEQRTGGRYTSLGKFGTAVEAAAAYARAVGEGPTAAAAPPAKRFRLAVAEPVERAASGSGCGANRPDMQIDVDVVDGFEFRSQEQAASVQCGGSDSGSEDGQRRSAVILTAKRVAKRVTAAVVQKGASSACESEGTGAAILAVTTAAAAPTLALDHDVAFLGDCVRNCLQSPRSVACVRARMQCLSQKQLAAVLHVSQASLSSWLKGVRQSEEKVRQVDARAEVEVEATVGKAPPAGSEAISSQEAPVAEGLRLHLSSSSSTGYKGVKRSRCRARRGWNFQATLRRRFVDASWK